MNQTASLLAAWQNIKKTVIDSSIFATAFATATSTTNNNNNIVPSIFLYFCVIKQSEVDGSSAPGDSSLQSLYHLIWLLPINNYLPYLLTVWHMHQSQQSSTRLLELSLLNCCIHCRTIYALAFKWVCDPEQLAMLIKRAKSRMMRDWPVHYYTYFILSNYTHMKTSTLWKMAHATV